MRSEPGTQEDLMQIRNATYDRRLDLLDCRMTVLGLDLYAIKNGEVFEELKRRCLDFGGPEARSQQSSLGDILSQRGNAWRRACRSRVVQAAIDADWSGMSQIAF
jgi:hypothetical protein